jgi:hypothetical protein
MGIGWTLQGADTANSARNGAVSMPGWELFAGGLDSGCVFARLAEGWGAVSNRTSAGGRLRSPGARSRFGMMLSIVASGGVDGCGVTRRWTVDLLTSEGMSDDAQGSASALWAGSVQCRSLLLAEQLGYVSLHRMEMDSAQAQRATSIAVGKQAEVPNLHETGREDVKKEAPDELLAIECHGAAAVVVCCSRQRITISAIPIETLLATIDAEITTPTSAQLDCGNGQGHAGWQTRQHCSAKEGKTETNFDSRGSPAHCRRTAQTVGGGEKGYGG